MTLRRALCFLGFLFCAAVGAQTAFPSKPVNIVVPFPPGGAADQPSRLFGRTPSFERSQFTPLGLLVADPLVLVVKADAPWKTYNDFVADARANPEKITYGSSGAYSASHLPIEMLAHAGQMKLRHISYSGGGPAILAVLGGHIGVTASSPSAVMTHIRAGTLRPLVTTGAKRIAALPDVPTALELGFKDAEFYV